MMNLNETNENVDINTTTGLNLDDLLLRGQVRRLADEMLVQYATISDEELDKHLSDDIVDFQQCGSPVLAQIAKETRENLRVNKVRDLAGYRRFINTNFDEFYKGFKKFMNMQ